MITALILWMVGWYFAFILATFALLFAAYGIVVLIEKVTRP